MSQYYNEKLSKIRCGKSHSLESHAIIQRKGAYLQSLILSGTKILKESKDGIQTHGGSAILIPFAGRIRNGIYNFEGRKYTLPINEPLGHSIHGFARDIYFRKDNETPTSVILSAEIDNDYYPGKLRIYVSYTLTCNALTSTYRVKNIGKNNAPLHVGIHPYFEFFGEWELTFSKKIYEIPNQDHLFPLNQRIPARQNYKNEAEYFRDHVFFYGGGNIMFHNGKTAVKIQRHNMPYLTMYSRNFAERNSLAIEPQSSIADSYNNKIGLRIIHPGQEISFYVRISVGE